MATLNENKPYGEVWGKPGVRFEQDNKLFNSLGYEVDWNGNLVNKEDVAKTLAGEPAQSAVSEGEQSGPSESAAPAGEQNTAPPAELRYESNGNGWYTVYGADGNAVPGAFRKKDAEAEVAKMKAAGNDQLSQSLQD